MSTVDMLVVVVTDATGSVSAAIGGGGSVVVMLVVVVVVVVLLLLPTPEPSPNSSKSVNGSSCPGHRSYWHCTGALDSPSGCPQWPVGGARSRHTSTWEVHATGAHRRGRVVRRSKQPRRCQAAKDTRGPPIGRAPRGGGGVLRWPFGSRMQDRPKPTWCSASRLPEVRGRACAQAASASYASCRSGVYQKSPDFFLLLP
jgi:hypothetical protein